MRNASVYKHFSKTDIKGNIELILAFLSIILLISTTTFAEDTMTEIVVNAPLSGLDIKDTTRHIEILYHEDLILNPVHSIDEILKYISSVDIIQRGPFGVQSDVGIRGGSFEHTLILLNGMRVNDPQTGHHNLNLPLSLADIDRIEIIPSGLGLLYSAGSFGGVINIVTKSKSDKIFEIISSIGSDGYIQANASTYLKKDNVNIKISAKGQKSDGYRLNTDFNLNSFQVNIDSKNFDIFGGFIDKRFGANGFYSLKYPLQWENTKTVILSGRLKTKIAEARFEPSIMYRHGYDYYLLNRSNPDFYKNTHKTNLVNLLLPLQYEQKNNTITGGIDLSFDDINSTRLGNHNRNSQAIFLGLTNKNNNTISSIDMRVDRFSKTNKIEVCPSLSFAYKMTNTVKIRGALNRSFRLPSYTELYYTSPIHKSNPQLKPEISYNLEGGIDLSQNWFDAKFTVFKRWGRNIIDWSKTGDIWISDNIDKLDTSGMTLSTFLQINEKNSLRVDYTWLNQNNDNTSINTYGNYLRHKINAVLSSKISSSIMSNLALIHQKRINQPSHTLFDIKITKKIYSDAITIFAEGKNIFNKGYYDIVGLPMPGRNLFLGMSLVF